MNACFAAETRPLGRVRVLPRDAVRFFIGTLPNGRVSAELLPSIQPRDKIRTVARVADRA